MYTTQSFTPTAGGFMTLWRCKCSLRTRRLPGKWDNRGVVVVWWNKISKVWSHAAAGGKFHQILFIGHLSKSLTSFLITGNCLIYQVIMLQLLKCGDFLLLSVLHSCKLDSCWTENVTFSSGCLWNASLLADKKHGWAYVWREKQVANSRREK